MQVSINHKNKSKMKKYIFNVLVAGIVAAQAVGYGVNEDDGLVDACFHMDNVFEDDIEDVVLISVEQMN